MMSAAPDTDDALTGQGEDNFRLLIDLLPDALIITAQARVVFANPSALRLFGAGRGQDLVGHHALELIDDRSLGLAMVNLADPPVIEQIYSYHMRRLNGDRFEAELTGRNIVFRDRPSRLLVIRDITKRSSALEQACQGLGQRLARLRHDLTQPLNVIRLAAEGALLMIERGKVPTTGWPESQFSLIAEQSELTSRILDGIRTAPRDEAPPVAVHPAGSHILVVEEDAAAAAALVQYLDGLGCRVSHAETGDEAWSRFQDDPADVVIAALPEPSGKKGDLIDALRDFDPWLPIIVTTTRPEGAERMDERCVVLKKPLVPSEIGRLIAAFLHPPPPPV